MKKVFSTLVVMLSGCVMLIAQSGVNYPEGFTPQANSSIGFKENKGQVSDQNYQPRPDVLFSGTDGNMVYHLKKDGIAYQLSRVDSWKEMEDGRPKEAMPGMEKQKVPDQTTIYRVDVNWLHANTKANIVTGEAQPGVDNYYTAVCPNGVTGVRSFNEVTYQNIYAGIHLKWYSKDGSLKYDYIVAPGSDYKQIQLQFEGAESLSINEQGELVIKTPLGELVEQAPLVTQNGKTLPSKWVIKNNIVSFEIGNIDGQHPLIIDPAVRAWGTYYGGTGWDYGRSCATDASGNVYLAGRTDSPTAIATAGAHQTAFGGGGWYDAFLVKFNSAGVRQWGTYYGGPNGDYGSSCATDASGNVYLAGETQSIGGNGIATAGAHQTAYAFGGGDAFLAKFNSAGVRQWGTYYGGTGIDFGLSCATDASGNVYLAGRTDSPTAIATAVAHQTASGGSYDAFLAKFNSAGVRQWGTYYGGTGIDDGNSCATDASGNVYLAGHTQSATAIATAGAHQTVQGNGGLGEDAFLAKFNSAGVRQWGTYYGGTGDDYGNSCATDASGNVYLAGQTTSANSANVIATGGTHQAAHGGGFYDAFLAKFNSAGARQWGTYYGGTGQDRVYSCATDASGSVYLAGETNSTTAIATAGAHQTVFGGGGRDAFLAKFNTAGLGFSQWGTYYGGTSDEFEPSCATDGSGNVYLAGYTNSTGAIATAGAHQTASGGSYDAFLAKFYSEGEALAFDGVNDAVIVPANPAFDFNVGTVECWFKPAGSADNEVVVAMRTAPGSTRWSIHVNEGANTIGVWNGIGITTVPATINPGVWYHLAVVMTTTGSTIYLNGILAGTIGSGINSSITGRPLSIGTPNDPVPANEEFPGSIDEVRIWSRALCQSEIQNNMNCEIPTTGSGLLANYHFNQGSAEQNNAGVTTLTDASGNGNNGTLQNFTLNGATSNWIAPGGVISGVSCGAFTPPAVSVSVLSQTNISCFGGNNGAASVSASGGLGFNYNWTPGNPTGDGTASVTGLTAGTWTCTVTNDCGGVGTQTFNIIQPPPLTSSISANPVLCFGGNTGSATATANGGTSPYSYNWSNSATTATTTGLSAGNYSCSIIDANGCFNMSNITITQPTPLVASPLSQTNISCNAGSNGAASVSVSGGTVGYTYNWTPGNPTGDGTASVTGLTAGTWTCTVTDANSCIASQTLNITAPTALVASVASQTNVSCNGGSNGSALCAVTGGTPAYSYNWSPSGGTGVLASGLSAGIYTCTVTDANSCTGTQTFNITQPAPLTSSISANDVLCFGGNTGSATASPSGGTIPYSYNWSNSATTATTTGLSAGNYSCSIIDANGCFSMSNITITQPTALVASSSATPILCNGGSSTVTVSGTGGTLPYTGDGTFPEIQGAYSYTITDNNGCTSTTTITITEPTALVASSSATPILCNGGSSTVTVSGTGGTSPYTGDGTFTEIQGAYSYTITDDNGCTSTTSVTITEPALLSASLTSTTDPSTCSGTDGAVDITVSGGTAGYTFLWNNAATTEDLSAVGAGAYNCSITDANGCTTTTTANLNDPNAPTVTLSLGIDTVCQSTTAPFALSGESPSGGIFSGPGVTGNTFDPMSANIGFNVITYTYTDINGCTGSTTDSIFVDVCTGTTSAITENTFILYPNPTSGVLNIITSGDKATIVVTDALGQQVMSIVSNSTTTEIDLSKHADGLYFVRVLQNGTYTTQRVTVAK